MKLYLRFAMIIAFILPGCALSNPIVPTVSPTPIETPKPALAEGKIVFTRYDGRKYVGTVYGHGETAIIFANMSYGNETQWQPFVDVFDRKKFTVITFNYLQIVADDYSSAEQEVGIILETLKSFGYTRVICIAASLGVSACASIAQMPEVVGLVLISGPNYGGSLDTKYPKLFIASKLDEWSAPTESEYNSAPDPKKLILYPDISSHGADLFYSIVGDQFLKSLLDFVNSIP